VTERQLKPEAYKNTGHGINADMARGLGICEGILSSIHTMTLMAHRYPDMRDVFIEGIQETVEHWTVEV
jgi:hypothetical protein